MVNFQVTDWLVVGLTVVIFFSVGLQTILLVEKLIIRIKLLREKVSCYSRNIGGEYYQADSFL